jgi:hypothetical protein
MSKIFLIIIFYWISTTSVLGQTIGLSFQEAAKKGITTKHLDSIYPSALHNDTTKAIFKTVAEQQLMEDATEKMVKDFTAFLKENNFNWSQRTKVFTKVYFNAKGTIDYFLYSFLGKDEEKPSIEVQRTFDSLLNVFIKKYKWSISSKSNYSQSIPTTFMPN